MEMIPSAEADRFVRNLTNDQFRVEIEREGLYLVHRPTCERVQILRVWDDEPIGIDPNQRKQIAELSKREWQVLLMLGDGREMGEIAAEIGVSAKTIETYRARLKKKLNIRGRANLMRLAFEVSLERRKYGNTVAG